MGKPVFQQPANSSIESPCFAHRRHPFKRLCAGARCRGGLRLGGLAGFQVFFGSGAYAPGASSSVLCSAVSNSAVKRTRILRAAYLGR